MVDRKVDQNRSKPTARMGLLRFFHGPDGVTIDPLILFLAFLDVLKIA